MHKASKELRALLPKVDLVIEILDARIPFSSQNPMLARLRGDKPCIKLLNKLDLADLERTKEWQDYFEREHNTKTLAVTNTQPEKLRQISALCHKMLPGKASRGRPLYVLVMGIPNVGKSTLINILAGRVVAKTGNEPAITKMQQRIDIGDDIVLVDTPGLLWHNIDNKNSGYRLATLGAIKDTAISHEDVAYFASEYLLRDYPHYLQSRFNLEQLPASDQELLTVLGKKRGCLRARGEVDYDKIAKILLGEIRTSSLGKITLETPAMMEEELRELALLREEKAAKHAAKLQQKKQ